MSEPSRSSGCFTSLLFLLAAVFGSFMAAFSTATSTLVSPTEIVTHVGLTPVGDFSTADLKLVADIIHTRLTGLGFSTATVVISGDSSIDVGLPPVVDHLDDVLKTLTARGLLEFVDFSNVPDSNQWQDRDILTTGQGDHPIASQSAVNPVTGNPFETILTGAAVQSATAAQSPQSGDEWQVRVHFSDEAGKILERYTSAHIGKPLAIVLDGKVLSVPVIQAALNTDAVIVGNFNEQESNQLAVQLGSGALPFEMRVTYIRSDTGIAISTATPTPHA